MKKILPFRFWCQKVLPLVYDDSLSYYELLCKVVDFLNKMAESLNKTNETLEQLTVWIDTLIESELKEIIDEMVEDGTLGALINDELLGEINEKVEALEYFQRVYVNWSGWRTFISQDGYLSAGVGLTLDVTECNAYDQGGSNRYSEYFYIAMPTPVNYLNVVGGCDVDGGWVSNIDNYKNIGCRFRVWFPYDYSSELVDPETDEPIPKKVTVRLVCTTVIRIAETDPVNASHDSVSGQSLVNIAQSYVNAQQHGRTFAYGRNFFYSSQPSDWINDSTGAGLMECDTFVGMCLRGIPYEKSPYINNTPNFTYDYDKLYTDVSDATVWASETSYSAGDLIEIDGELSKYWECVYPHTSGDEFNPTYWKSIWIINPNNLGWSTYVNSLIHPENEYLNRDIKFASDYAFMCWELNNWSTNPSIREMHTFSNKDEVKTGDLAFWVRRSHQETYWGGYSESPSFDNVGHVAIISVEDGVRYMYHVSVASVTDGKVVQKRTLDDLSEQPAYYGRII